VEQDEEIDWEKSVTMGVKCEKSNDPSNVRRVPTTGGKVALIFRATVAVRDGNISYIFNMVPKKIVSPDNAVVTVKVDTPLPAGATSIDLLSTEGGVRNWVKSYQDTSAAVGGTITITVKTTPATVAPFIVGNNDVIFTQDTTTQEWTGEVEVVSADQTILISANSFHTVTLSVRDGVTMVSPAPSAGSNSVAQYAFSNGKTGSDEEFGPVTFTVEVPAGWEPKLADALTNWDAEIAPAEGNQWTITLTGNNSAANLSNAVVAQMGQSVTLLTNDNNVKLDATTTYPVTNGKATVSVFAKKGFTPAFTGAGAIAAKLTKGAENNGMVAWTAELSGITATQNVTVTAVNIPKATVTIASSLTVGTAADILLEHTELLVDGVEIVNGTMTFNVYVSPKYAPTITTGANTVLDGGTATITTEGYTKPNEAVKWTVTVEGITGTLGTTVKVELDLANSFRVGLSAPGASMKLNANSLPTDKDGKAVFTATVTDPKYIPYVVDAANGSGSAYTTLGITYSAGSAEIKVEPGDNANEWKIIFMGVTKSGNVTANVESIPVVRLVSNSTGITPDSNAAVVTRVGAGKYVATLGFTLAAGYNLKTTSVSAEMDGAAITAAGAFTSGAVTQVGNSNRYEFTVALENQTSPTAVKFEDKIVNVSITANNTYAVTLETDEHIHLASDQVSPAMVESGKYAEFYVTVDRGYHIVQTSGDNFNVTAKDNEFLITSKDPVTAPLTIALTSEPTTDFQYTASVENTRSQVTVEEIDGVASQLTSSSPAKVGMITRGEVEFLLHADAGYVPTVEVTPVGGEVIADVEMTYEGGVPGNKGVWLVTLTNIKADPEIEFSAKKIVKSNANESVTAVYDESGVTLANTTFGSTTGTPDFDEVAQFGMTIQGDTLDATTKKASFIVFVADGFSLEDGVFHPNYNSLLESITVTKYRGGATIHAQDGYETMVVTVTGTATMVPSSSQNLNSIALSVKAPTGNIPTTPSN
jgi:hypothetical protein